MLLLSPAVEGWMRGMRPRKQRSNLYEQGLLVFMVPRILEPKRNLVMMTLYLIAGRK